MVLNLRIVHNTSEVEEEPTRVYLRQSGTGVCLMIKDINDHEWSICELKADGTLSLHGGITSTSGLQLSPDRNCIVLTR